jgi:diguanylate cyclase (GGDEF)-like protein
VSLAAHALGADPSPVTALVAWASLVVMGGYALAVRRPQIPLVWLERSLLGICGALAWVSLVVGLHVLPEVPAAAAGARAMLHWLPVLFLFAYVAFDAPWAGRVALALYLLALATTAPATLLGAGGALGPRAVEAMVQVFLAYAVLLAGLSFFAGQQRRLSAWRATAEEMQALALTDALTGVANRRWAEAQIEVELARADRYRHGFAVLMLDIDRFKALNDAHGHPAGDVVLVELAARLRSMVRSTDHVTRWGGEEFLVIAPETPLAAAVELAESLRARVAIEPLGAGHLLTVSLGVAAFRAGDTRRSLVERADVALYRAKRDGRDRVAAEAEVGATTATELEAIG